MTRLAEKKGLKKFISDPHMRLQYVIQDMLERGNSLKLYVFATLCRTDAMLHM